MANGNGNGYLNGNGNNNPTKGILILIISTGLLGVLASGAVSIANDAKIAIKVAEQHGEELLLIRGELASLRVEMLERTQSRYTATDADRHERYMEQRVSRLEEAIEECCQR